MNLISNMSPKGTQQSFFQSFLSGSKRLLAATVLWFTAGTLSAQTADVHLVMVPSTAQIGDTVSFEVHASTSNPISGFESAFYFAPDLYDISNHAFLADSSWLGDPCDLNVFSLAESDTLTLELERSDSRSYTGMGKVAELEGIVILDDIHTKRQSAQLLYTKETLGTRMQLFPNPSRGRVKIDCPSEVQSVRLVDMAGEVWEIAGARIIQLTHLPDGLYYMEVKTTTGQSFYERLLLQK